MEYSTARDKSAGAAASAPGRLITGRTPMKPLTESWPEMIETAMMKQEGVAEALKTSDQIVGRFSRYPQLVQNLHKFDPHQVLRCCKCFSGVL